MKKETIYAMIWEKISNGKLLPDGKTTFERICKESGAGRVEADNLFYEKLGMSGDDVMLHFMNKEINVMH